MGNREEALRRIFEATGVQARLSEDQQRELLAHLEDAVEAKVGAGVPEMDAVGRAFAELGDLKKIAQGFPAPAIATAGGPAFRPWTGGLAELGYGLLLFFTFAQLAITPKLFNLFVRVRVPMPDLSLVLWSFSDAMKSFWPLLAVLLAALGILLFRVRRTGRWKAAIDATMGLVGAALLGGLFAGVALPFVLLLEGLARR